MEFIVSRNRLLQALNHARTVMSSKMATPLFGNFFFTFSEDGTIMTVHSSDGEIWFSESVVLDATAVESRSISVWYHELLKALKALDEQPLRFIVGEMQMTVKHSCGQFRLPLGGNAEEFFSFSGYKRIHFDDVPHECAEFEAPGLRSILNRCKIAMAEDELRPVMNGIYFNFTEDYADFVSSDGHRLIRVRKAPMDNAVFSLIVHRKVVQSLLRILPGDVFLDYMVIKEKNIKNEEKETYIAKFTIDDTITLSFQPLDGRYPNYMSVIPTSFNADVTVDRRAFIKSVDRISIFADYSSECVRMNIADNTITLNASDKDFELGGEETIPCEYVNNGKLPTLLTGLKASGIASLFKHLDTQKVVIHFIDGTRCFIIEPVPQPDYEDVLMLQMPMMLSD